MKTGKTTKEMECVTQSTITSRQCSKGEHNPWLRGECFYCRKGFFDKPEGPYTLQRGPYTLQRGPYTLQRAHGCHTEVNLGKLHCWTRGVLGQIFMFYNVLYSYGFGFQQQTTSTLGIGYAKFSISE